MPSDLPPDDDFPITQQRHASAIAAFAASVQTGRREGLPHWAYRLARKGRPVARHGVTLAAQVTTLASGVVASGLKRVIAVPGQVVQTYSPAAHPVRCWPLIAAQTHPEPARLRSLFLSDLHLGNTGSRADLVLQFLKSHRAETYYLVGDILDLWLPFGTEWRGAQQRVIEHLRLRKSEGAEIVFVRGNHDPMIEGTPVLRRLPVVAVPRTIHTAADGRRYLVLHGDTEDFGLFKARWLEWLGTAADQVLRRADRLICTAAAGYGRDWQGVMPRLMLGLNTLLYAGCSHEARLVGLARDEGLDGIICGHFHLPALHDAHGLVYANCGDWLDNFSALAEDHQGSLQLLKVASGVGLNQGQDAATPAYSSGAFGS